MQRQLFQHPDRKGIYVTKSGEVYRKLPLFRGDSGYMTTVLDGENVRRHVLMIETFIGLRKRGMVVRHKDGNAANDAPTNLEWGTQGDNMRDMMRHGRSTKGEKNARAILNAAQVGDIKSRLRDGESSKKIAADYGVSGPTISNIKTGTTWSHIK